MIPSFVDRPAFLVACARPRFRRIVVASSMFPLASVSAALHSIMPAPVASRSCFTIPAVISIPSHSLVVTLARIIGEQPAQPSLVDEEHAAALRLLGHGVLRLALRADEQDRSTLGRQVRRELL